MPPAKEGCRFDDSGWRKQVEDKLWRSDSSLSHQILQLAGRVNSLEDREKRRDMYVRLILPAVFAAVTTGLFFLLSIIKDQYLQ